MAPSVASGCVDGSRVTNALRILEAAEGDAIKLIPIVSLARHFIYQTRIIQYVDQIYTSELRVLREREQLVTTEVNHTVQGNDYSHIRFGRR
jgi:hypothetical protein